MFCTAHLLNGYSENNFRGDRQLMKRKILIVEDVKLNREIIKRILCNEYDILEAQNGQEALNIMDDKAAGLSAVLLDLSMPVMNGFEVLSHMRADPKLKQLPVIVTTGQTEDSSEVKALQMGANDYVSKPYNAAIIRQRIWNAINLQEKIDLALSLGATRGFRADDPDVVAQLRAAIPGGVDIAIEAASSVPALDLAWKLTRRGGTTVTCSLPNPAHHLQLPVVQMTAEERTLKGSYLGSAVPARDIPRFIELYRAGRLPVDRLITHRLRLAEINQGFDRLAAGQAVRQVVVF